MKVYLDIILLTNYLFDFILLFSLSVLLKRNTKLYRIILGTLLGSLTLIILFIRMNSFVLFLYKFIISILMVLVTFGYKNIKYTIKNIYFLYIISIVMGGFLYFINNQLSYTNNGILFINNNFKLNILLGIILSIIFLIHYIKEIKDLKQNYNKYYKVILYLKDSKKLLINGFLDTGNKLIDPYKKRPIILVNEEKIDNIEGMKTILVPYSTVSDSGMLKCIIPSKIYINGIECKKKFLIGIIKNINIDGIDCILNEKLLEGLS